MEPQLTWTQEWKANGSRVNKEAMQNSDTRCIARISTTTIEDKHALIEPQIKDCKGRTAT
ncbi:hypothetical protein HanRHA438_Chr11g0503711 [Helianthus annuus]|uniref:Uncharacterized protein n=1 Tax=Helianthus annuus TaxID=4232 RepID=A0A9K3HPQ0_HELAN|nr:hypothetical protein HanXRQr2_Chr11g0490981 [Helianthus annuus]KAJ0870734.1 hypothetical protein HanRHA438_Chr11g0503711 [Helianthus annuus]KAJ0875184.1 hypothetical protein HanPSC8_Chr11g0473141 [Helianthus annuus]